MKQYVVEFFRRGLVACGFGPLILAILYLALQKQANLETLTVNQVCLGIFSINTEKLNQMLKEKQNIQDRITSYKKSWPIWSALSYIYFIIWVVSFVRLKIF